MKPLLLALAGFLASDVHAQFLTLQNATATFSQGGADVRLAIDGYKDSSGWAIEPAIGTAQTAVFETQSDAGFSGGSILTFSIAALHTITLNHNLGRFRLSLTTDDRNTFADGYGTGGDVTAQWIVLDLATFSSANGQTLTKQPDLSVLASGTNPATDTLTVSAPTSLTGITGIRLEMLPDATLPRGGPGRAFNGNFVVSEITVSITAIPEPEQYAAAFGVTLLGTGVWLRRKRV
ncbi:MAG: hypothetical protein RIS76_2921 [Verrucomicrobiota bacterium]